MRSSSLNLNFDVAQRFLDALEPNGKFTFQTFDDDQDRRDKSLARQLNGTLREHFDQLRSLQEKGAGIFVTINQNRPQRPQSQKCCCCQGNLCRFRWSSY